MLEYIKVKNINSIGEAEMSFIKDKYKFREDNVFGNLVFPIAIYGTNGSGKSSFINSISQFIELFVKAVDFLQPFLVNQFKFNEYMSKRSKNKDYLTGSVELHFRVDDKYYEYFIAVNRIDFIVHEYLKCDEIIFERKGKSETYEGVTTEIDPLKRSLLIPTLRYLSQENISNEAISQAFSFITSLNIIDLTNLFKGSFMISKSLTNVKTIDLLVEKSKEVNSLLSDFKEFPKYEIIKKENVKNYNSSQYFIKYENLDSLLPVEFMSAGMTKLSTLLSSVLALPTNSILFIDEIDESLHNETADAFIDFIKKRHIQLVFTSHNTNLLENLRPDQVYFAYWNKGISTLKRLSKIYPNIREVNNIGKMYLSSVFDEAIHGKE